MYEGQYLIQGFDWYGCPIGMDSSEFLSVGLVIFAVLWFLLQSVVFSPSAQKSTSYLSWNRTQVEEGVEEVG